MSDEETFIPLWFMIKNKNGFSYLDTVRKLISQICLAFNKPFHTDGNRDENQRILFMRIDEGVLDIVFPHFKLTKKELNLFIGKLNEDFGSCMPALKIRDDYPTTYKDIRVSEFIKYNSEVEFLFSDDSDDWENCLVDSLHGEKLELNESYFN